MAEPKTKYKTLEYGDVEYWNARYEKDVTQRPNGFEWYPGAEALFMEALNKYVPNKNCTILDLGCGSSQLAELVSRAGYGSIIAVDSSKVVIGQRKAAVPDSAVRYELLDLNNQQLKTLGMFQAILDKGTLDALDCGGLTQVALEQVCAALAPGGMYLLMSCRVPDWRLPDVLPLFNLEATYVLPDANPKSPCAQAHLYCLTPKHESAKEEVTPPPSHG